MAKAKADSTPKKGRTGRPSIRTPEIREAAIDAVEKYGEYEIAFSQVPASRSALFAWKAKDKDFSDALEKARLQYAARALSQIEQDPSWQSRAWRLERMFPEKFAKREHLDVTSKNKPVTEIRIVRTPLEPDPDD